MRYGLPYQGSKNQIAENIINVLPRGKRLVDLFGGGGAISHCAVLSGKWKSVYYNDFNPIVVDFFRRTINGDFSHDRFTPEWVIREDFFRLKDTDGYVKYVWSFGNDGKTYIFGKDIEEAKRIIFNAVISGDTAELSEFLQKPIKFSGLTYIERRAEWRKFCAGNFERHGSHYYFKNFNNIESIESLERLQSLESLQRRNISINCGSYLDYDYQNGDIVYCDIPYEGTTGYDDKEFNHKEFYDWAYSRPYQVFFSSYDNVSDKRFKIIYDIGKRSLMLASNNSTIKMECLYTNRTDYSSSRQTRLF